MIRTLTFLALMISMGVSSAWASDKEGIYTLYRTSSFTEPLLRIHFATFDANERPAYNQGACEMIARLLNANLHATFKAAGRTAHPKIGFWCEHGRFRKEGPIPNEFPKEFPTDSQTVD